MHAGLYAWWLSVAAYLKSSAFNEIWIQSLILLVSAAIAIVTLRSTSRSERRRATFDIVRDQQKDSVLIAARALVRSLHYQAGGIDVPKLLAEKDSAEIQAIFSVLNSYEFVATGMKNGAFDRKTYKSMYHNNVVTNWAMLREFVVRYRAKYELEHAGVKGMRADTLFQDFENLAAKWERRPLKKKNPVQRDLNPAPAQASASQASVVVAVLQANDPSAAPIPAANSGQAARSDQGETQKPQ